MPVYDLIDGEVFSRQLPTRYQIPPSPERKGLLANSWVELGFIQRGTPAAIERLLVQVKEKEEGQDIYYGILGQHPQIISTVRIGDSIQFTSKNILAIIQGE